MTGMEIFMVIIVPVLLFILIGGVVGFALAFTGEKIKIDRNPKIDETLRFLAGANCGGCGYPGCEAFAVALVKGETELNKCNPTSEENKQNIAKVLERDYSAGKKMRAIVHCNGGNKCKNKYDYQGLGDCQSAELIAGGSKACRVGCIGLGSCHEYCSYNAVSVDKDKAVAIVDKTKCVDCGACITACPKKIISRIPYDAKVFINCSNTWRGKDVRNVCENGCIACGLCQKKCPTLAISLSNNLAVINYDKCISCGICAEVCPSKCIHVIEKIDREEALKSIGS